MPVLSQTIDANTRVWTTFDLSMKIHPVTGDISLKRGDHAVQSAINNLLKTNFYERWHAELAGGIPGNLFDLLTPTKAQELKKQVTNCITQYEPRFKLTNVTVTTAPQVDAITIGYSGYMQNSNSPVTGTVFLKRIR